MADLRLLSARQLGVLIRVLFGVSIEDAASELGVDLEKAGRWLSKPDFVIALRDEKRNLACYVKDVIAGKVTIDDPDDEPGEPGDIPF